MYKLLTAALLILCCIPVSSGAQSFWRNFERVDAGGSILFYNHKHEARITDDPGSEFNEDRTFSHIGLMFGLNLPVYPMGDNMSLGICPGIGFSVATETDFFGEKSQFIAASLPLYATFKLGADATYKGSTFPLGMSVGLGYHYSYLMRVGDGAEFSEGIGLPSMMAEVCIGKRKKWGLIKLRFTQDLGSYTIDYSDPSRFIENKLTISRTGLHLIYVGGY